jgi:hypothetical protein
VPFGKVVVVVFEPSGLVVSLVGGGVVEGDGLLLGLGFGGDGLLLGFGGDGLLLGLGFGGDGLLLGFEGFCCCDCGFAGWFGVRDPDGEGCCGTAVGPLVMVTADCWAGCGGGTTICVPWTCILLGPLPSNIIARGLDCWSWPASMTESVIA